MRRSALLERRDEARNVLGVRIEIDQDATLAARHDLDPRAGCRRDVRHLQLDELDVRPRTALSAQLRGPPSKCPRRHAAPPRQLLEGQAATLALGQQRAHPLLAIHAIQDRDALPSFKMGFAGQLQFS